MKVRKVNRYTCDFCKKSNCSGGAISKHQKFCTMNPDRGCRMCKHPVKPLSLISLLPDSKQFLKVGKEYDSGEHYEGWKDTYKEPLEKIKEECNYCPACVLAVLRQSKIPLYMLDFDYKKEVEEWWKEKNEEGITISSFEY